MKNLKWIFSLSFVVFGIACEPVPIGGGGTTINNNVTVNICVDGNGGEFDCTDADGDGYTVDGYRCVDEDGDGIASCTRAIVGLADCNDGDPLISPGAPERCNGIDDDCDGQIDDGIMCPCNDGNACTTDTWSGLACAYAPVPGCCNPVSQACMAGQVCTATTASRMGMCVQCVANSNCSQDSMYCNGQEVCMNNTCTHTGDPCRAGGPRCDEASNACILCDGPNDDARCQGSFQNLPQFYHEGCSTGPVTTNGEHACTTYYDGDCDGYRASAEVCGYDGWDEDGDGFVDENLNQCIQPPPGACNPPDAGVSDSGTPDMGMLDSGVPPDSGVWPDASIADAGSSGCLPQQTCAAGYYWACSQCVVFVDQHGRTPAGLSGANGGPQADGTADDWDNDGDCYCEVSTPQNPCLGTVSSNCAVLLGGDCDDTQTGFGNHPGATEWSDNYDNDCNGVVDG